VLDDAGALELGADPEKAIVDPSNPAITRATVAILSSLGVTRGAR
jgi:hypothetical protein